ncbi:hypothetical protein Poli38472_004244 [Pythium oligandrum]|uniref:Uncharacterized protein n=1 Tax=Pythium oligandrum TaxID=41045 RepID=A0A8K1FMP0_PYTOL|nr:hypothetical protein Poli38472_004244 [Pythium oligandrum]|eukprot:TMW66479.1 hypothetical protein Poli38472_004244 [Pythium oligandrum]
MEVELRVTRAHVWLSSALVGRQETFLALLRVDSEPPQLYHGSLEDSVEVPRGRKRWQTVPIRWLDPTRQSKAAQGSTLKLDETLPSVDVAVFAVLRPHETQADKEQIHLVAETTWSPSEKDVNAIRGSQEVVIASTLKQQRGTVEVCLRQRREETKDAVELTSDEARGSFSMHWTPSDALEQDLQAKERERVAHEKKLVRRLESTLSKARRLEVMRDEALVMLQRRRAAQSIQREYRRVLDKRRELRDAEKKVLEAQQRAKKLAVRAKVVERSERRTREMLDQLKRRHQPPRLRDERVEGPIIQTRDLTQWRRLEEAKTYHKLYEKLQRLEDERQQKLAELAISESIPEIRQVRTRYEPGRDLDDALIRAIHHVHLRK